MTVADLVREIEATGVTFRIDGERVRVYYPDDERRKNLAEQIAFLRAHRREVTEFLRARSINPVLPCRVKVIRWSLKDPPVALETCAVVTDPAMFARTTLEQLRIALAEPTRWVGWTVPQLIDRRAQVGVIVLLESRKSNCSASSQFLRAHGGE